MAVGQRGDDDAMTEPFLAHLRSELEQVRASGLYKSERVIKNLVDDIKN